MEQNLLQSLREQIASRLVGKEAVIEQVLTCLLAGGHILIEDVPGVGKTTLARTLAESVSADFGRIQFTPDTLPGDVIGTSVFNQKTAEFEYRPGAVMHSFLLADEINRTSPKTQSALLEAMSEGQVTVDGVRYELPELFMVLATQNPTEFLGTYPLPEAQLDRFMMRLSIGYPDKASEVALTRNALEHQSTAAVTPVCDAAEVLRMRAEAESVRLSDKILEYIQEIVNLTRREESFVIGVSPRATIFLARAARAKAYLEGRDFVKPDDVKAVCIPVLHHRLSLTPQARIQQKDVDAILTALMLKAKVPME